MNISISKIRKKTVSVNQYTESLNEPFREKFLRRKQTYKLKKEAINQLKKYSDKYVVVAFSAVWCKDCIKNIPVLALISEAAWKSEFSEA